MNQMRLQGLAHLPVAAIVYRYQQENLEICYMNHGAETMWGCTLEEAQKTPISQLFAAVHPEDVHLFTGMRQACKQGLEKMEPVCFRLVRQARVRWLQMDVSAVTEDAGLVMYTTITDVSVAKHTETQLRIQQEEYRIASERDGVYVFRYDVKDKTLCIGKNPGGTLVYRQAIEDVPNNFIKRGFVAPESIGTVHTLFNDMQDKKKTGKQQIRCVIGGVEQLIQVQYTLFADEYGEDTVAVGFFQEVKPSAGQAKLFQLVAAHSQKHIFRFGHQSKKVVCVQSPGEDDVIARWVEGFINEGKRSQVPGQYMEKLEQFYQQMLDGVVTSTLEYPVNEQGNLRWYRTIFTNVMEEVDSNPYAVISVEDCTQERERAKVYALYQQEKVNLKARDSMMEYNVTQRVIVGIWGVKELVDNMRSAEEVIKTHLEQFVFAKDSEKVAAFFDPERMLQAFANGIGVEEMEHRIVLDGKMQWVLSKVKYFQDPYTQDVMALIASKSVQEQHEKLETLRGATYLDSVTGLYQYQTFQEKVDALCAQVTLKSPGQFALVGFRMERDATERLGLEGVLNHVKKVASTMKTLFSNGEVIGRLEGYQFGVYVAGESGHTLLPDKLQLAMELMKYEKEGVQYLRPYYAVVDCIAGEDNTLTLWQKTLQMIEIRKKTARSNGVSKVPYITYDAQSRVAMRAFGFFDVFVDGQAIHFKTAKAKELLAILVDRCGGYVDASEGAMLLYEDDVYDERLKSKYRKVVMRLDEILREQGIEEIVGKQGGSRKINTQQVYCDYYRYLSGEENAKQLFNDAYMSNYSWGEETLANLIRT